MFVFGEEDFFDGLRPNDYYTASGSTTGLTFTGQPVAPGTLTPTTFSGGLDIATRGGVQVRSPTVTRLSQTYMKVSWPVYNPSSTRIFDGGVALSRDLDFVTTAAANSARVWGRGQGVSYGLDSVVNLTMIFS